MKCAVRISQVDFPGDSELLVHVEFHQQLAEVLHLLCQRNRCQALDGTLGFRRLLSRSRIYPTLTSTCIRWSSGSHAWLPIERSWVQIPTKVEICFGVSVVPPAPSTQLGYNERTDRTLLDMRRNMSGIVANPDVPKGLRKWNRWQ